MPETKAQEPLSLGLFYAERDAAQADGSPFDAEKIWDIKTLPSTWFFSNARPMTAQCLHWRRIFFLLDRKDDQDLIALVKHLIVEYGRCIEWKTICRSRQGSTFYIVLLGCCELSEIC